MNLHEDTNLFADVIAKASSSPLYGGLGLRQLFIEKDYWITKSLKHLSESQLSMMVVFKGGTSLSKAFNIGRRFSEDIDIAVIRSNGGSDAKLKNVIRSIEKTMATDLYPINHPLSSKGSRYRKTFYSYPTILTNALGGKVVLTGQILFEINSFANPFPYQEIEIRSFVYDYLKKIERSDIIEDFNLHPFKLNVLDKRTTMTEKLVSLMRFSLSRDFLTELEAKIRHFYDLHFLLMDAECHRYLFSQECKNIFIELIEHDRNLFDKPEGWREKSLSASPLLTNFQETWERLRKRYKDELPFLTFSSDIPDAKDIEKSLVEIMDFVKRTGI
ncbi:MAG: nucleotidyl transferase AbiEii/AbiGii toxin family protein [Muribaculaceae bacterium]|nr:nucleotidyl transferase AbiEii/AbiGii toxin family protein [Muribaculaceae bacterium]